MKFTKSVSLNLLALLAISLLVSCSSDSGNDPTAPEVTGERLTIFFINDPHGRINNFAKVKHIVDAERANNEVLLVSAGDLFSGNPIVDQHPEKGSPMIDLMNQAGFDISVMGNHEFDYGLATLQDRVDQSDFPWILANMQVGDTELAQPDPYKTLTVGELKITFLGLVETNGQDGKTIPSTHPWRVRGLTFTEHGPVADQYGGLKAQEGADLVIGLTHLGLTADLALARSHSYFDVIIGGHSSNISTDVVNGTPVLMAGANLDYLGKIELTISDQRVLSWDISMINLNEYNQADAILQRAVENYNATPLFDQVVGTSQSNMDLPPEVGCFFTTAIKSYLQVDVAFQNHGGIRAPIDQGDITKMEIYTMDPFNNGSVIFTRSVGDLKRFLMETRAAMHFTGVDISNSGGSLSFKDENGNELDDNTMLRLGMNDYIAAIYEDYFPFEEAEIRNKTTAESIIDYLDAAGEVNFEGCDRTVRY